MLAKYIDPSVQSPESENLTDSQQLESNLRQLPWFLETAVIRRLEPFPQLFDVLPRDQFPDIVYLDVESPVATAAPTPYYDGESQILDYRLAPSASDRPFPHRGVAPADEEWNQVIVGPGSEVLGVEPGQRADRSRQNNETSAQSAVSWAASFAEWYRPVRLGLLRQLVSHDRRSPLVVRVACSPAAVVRAALLDLAVLISHTSQMFDVVGDWPKVVQVQSSVEPPAGFLELLERVLSTGPEQVQLETLPFRIDCTVFSDFDEVDASPDVVVDLSRDSQANDDTGPLKEAPVVGRDLALLETSRKWYGELRETSNSSTKRLVPTNLNKRLLDSFARRFLRIPALRHHRDENRRDTEQRQYELVHRVMQQKKTFGVLPTGSGKSAAFQLPAMLLPGSALVISPLRALMRDQLHDLRHTRGLNAVKAIRGELTRKQKDAATSEFLSGHISLLYVSPERLEELSFAKTMAEQAVRANLSFLAIDEVHCVSEWGHDFRLSYMHIPFFVEELATAGGHNKAPIIGLTATASAPVRHDVCSILGFNENDVRSHGDLVAETNVDRTELSLSVHMVDGNSYPQDRFDRLSHVLQTALPSALRDSIFEGRRWEDYASGDCNGTASGAIFCMYKDSHGKNTWRDSVGAIQDVLVQDGLLDESAAKIYAAQSPGACPECVDDSRTTYSYRNLPRRESPDGVTNQCECTQGHLFPSNAAVRDNKWDQRCINTQHAFKRNEFPLLITTKAYGMGIDHRGLRFVVHHAMSSSLESYYQEIGRAGRDNKHAHCALLVRQPTPHCLENYFRKGLSYSEILDAEEKDFLPPCLTGRYRASGSCHPDQGLPEPCDLSRQLHMTIRSYLLPKKFSEDCAEFWETIRGATPDDDGFRQTLVPGSNRGGQQQQKYHNFLYRSKQLGLVEVYRLQYHPRTTTVFDIEFHVRISDAVTRESVLTSLIDRRYAIERTGEVEIASGKCSLSRRIRGDAPEGEDVTAEFIEWAFLTLYKAVRANVIRMRWETLRNLGMYVQAEDCRRGALVGPMAVADNQQLITEKCGFCDRCVPDLKFSRQSSATTETTAQTRDLLANSQDAIKRDSVHDGLECVEEGHRRGILSGMRNQAQAYLQQFPENATAQLVAGIATAFSPDPEIQKYSPGYLEAVATRTNLQEQDVDRASVAYCANKMVDITEAIRRYAVVDSACDTKSWILTASRDSARASLEDDEQASLEIAAVAESCSDGLKSTVGLSNLLDRVTVP